MSATLEMELPKGRKKPKEQPQATQEAPAVPYAVGGRLRWRKAGHVEHYGPIVRVVSNCAFVRCETEGCIYQGQEIGCWFHEADTTVLDYSEPVEYVE
jgi:hypothetical protein